MRSKLIAALNNIRMSQRRQATAMAAKKRAKDQPKTALEVQHNPVETYYNDNIVGHRELGTDCPRCQRVVQDGLQEIEKKLT